MTTVIRTADLVKRYGRVRALDGLDLQVEEGQVHGFLGPNGAGKSTTIRILLGLARATSGEASVFGGHPWRDAVALHRRIASVPGDVSVWPNLSGGEAIDLLARLRGAPRPGTRRHIRQDRGHRFAGHPPVAPVNGRVQSSSAGSARSVSSARAAIPMTALYVG